MKIKSCMLDFDGTVTEKGSTDMPCELRDKITNYLRENPLAFCTGRSVSFVREKIFNSIMQVLESKERSDVNSNLYFFTENGSIGGKFSDCGENFNKIYEIEWPDEISKEMLMNVIENEFKYGLEFPSHKFDVAFVFRAYDESGGYVHGKVVRERFLNACESVYPDIHEHLHFGASKRSLTIGPIKGDKDYALLTYADILRQERQMQINDTLDDILIVGNNPQKGGNDYKLLNSGLGRSYSVEGYEDGARYDLVVDENGIPLQNADGMMHLFNTYLH